MPCYRPIKGYRSVERNPSGKRSIVFDSHQGHADLPVELPCGQCIGCRLERSRQWATRCIHEASLYENNCFVTLTYDDNHLPPDGSLHKKDFQDFIKRLREKQKSKKNNANKNSKIRYFHCGEYGEKFSRPHYHACIFNFDFDDKVLFKESNGSKLFISEELSTLWPFGFCLIGDVTFESAAYVARYVTKKITGRAAADHYGEKTPEYITMSRRPGIGRGWLEKFSKDLDHGNYCVVRGVKTKVPKFYAHIIEIEDQLEYKKVQAKKKVGALERAEDNTHERLIVKENVQYRRLEDLKRGFEDGT